LQSSTGREWTGEASERGWAQDAESVHRLEDCDYGVAGRCSAGAV